MTVREPRSIRHFAGAALLATSLLGAAAIQARADEPCVIPQSACYPWRIAADRKQTTILNVVPNNATTGAIYRICLCPPEKAVEVIFSFATSDIVIGRVAAEGNGPVCRDYRIETSRTSRLVLRRPPDTDGTAITGCYVTAPGIP